MRFFVSAAALGICGLLTYGAGCSATPPNAGTGGGGEGGVGAAGGAAGAGGQGGAPCVPVTELCDGQDNDCDLEVDEGCSCIEGDKQECYSGPMDTKGKGVCVAGQQECNIEGVWGACVGQVLPTKEKCNNVDDDCNDLVDDMGMLKCGFGACEVTVAACDAGVVGECVPGNPSVEECNGIDDDCDLLTDETYTGKGQDCVILEQKGECSKGKMDCKNAAPTCVQTIFPALVEACNGKDENCDGEVDNNIPGTGTSCGTGLPGICSDGTYSCKNAMLDCHPNTPAKPSELCNGLDDDCDMKTDEDDPEGGGACMTGQMGVCATGVWHCTMGALACVPDAISSTESCNGLDDNCDGQVDENNAGGGGPCGCGGTNQCMNGQLQCIGGPTTYFSEDFSDNSAGWTLDTEWQIGSAIAGCSDPGMDTTATDDNGVAGVMIGGCASTSLHGYYYLTSPVINTSAAPTLFLQFQRWLQTDYTPYMNSTLEVFNGSSWVIIYQNGSSSVYDASWAKVSFDIAAHKNANMRIRWGFNVGSSGVFSVGQWNIDDVLVATSACP